MGVFDDISATWRDLDYFGSEGAITYQYKRRLKEREVAMLRAKLNPVYTVDNILSADRESRTAMLEELDVQLEKLNDEGHLFRLNKEIFLEVRNNALRAESELFDVKDESGVLYNYTIGMIASGLTSFAWNLKNLGASPENLLIQDIPGIAISKAAAAIPNPVTRIIGSAAGLGAASAVATIASNKQRNAAVETLNYYNTLAGVGSVEKISAYEGTLESASLGAVYSLPIVTGLRFGGKRLLQEAKRGVEAVSPYLRRNLVSEKFVRSIIDGDNIFNKPFKAAVNSPSATARTEAYRRIMESNRAIEMAIKDGDFREANTLYTARQSQVAAVTEELYPNQFANKKTIAAQVVNFVKESLRKVDKKEIFVKPTKDILSPNKTLVEGVFNVVRNNGKQAEKGSSEGFSGKQASATGDAKAVRRGIESGYLDGAEAGRKRRKRVFSSDNNQYDYLTSYTEEVSSIAKRVLRFTEGRFNKTKEFKSVADEDKAMYLKRSAANAVDNNYYDWGDIDLNVKSPKAKQENVAKFNSNMYHKYFVSALPMDGFSNKHLQAIPESARAEFMEHHFYPAKGAVSDNLSVALELGLDKVKFTWPQIISQYEINHLKNGDVADAARLYNRAVNHHKIIDLISGVGEGKGLTDYTDSYSDASANIRSTMDGFLAKMSERLSDYRYKGKKFGEMLLDDAANKDILRTMFDGDGNSPLANEVVSEFRRLEKFVMETYSDLGYGKDELSDFFISSFDRLILEKYGVKGDFINTLTTHMDIEKTLGIPVNHPAAAGRAKSFATEMYEGILSRDAAVYKVDVGVNAQRKKYFPKNGSAYINILEKFGAQNNFLELVGTYIDKHANTLARIQLYGDPFEKAYFLEHVQQFTGAAPSVSNSVYSTLDFVYSSAFPINENFFSETLGWISSIKNGVNLLGSAVTAFTLDKAPMALAIADATNSAFLGIRAALIDSFKPMFYKNKAEFNKAMFFSENIARLTVGLMRDNLNKAIRTRFDEALATINGLRSVTQAHFFVTEYTITHAWYEAAKRSKRLHPNAFGITAADWQLFMDSPNAVTHINGIGIRHPRQLMVHGANAAERAVGRKIGHYLSRTVNSGVLNSLDTKARKTLNRGLGVTDSSVARFLTNEAFIYATAPLQIITRIYPLMLRMVDRAKYGEFAAIVVMATGLAYVKELIKDLANGRTPSSNIQKEVTKAFLGNDLVLGYFGQLAAYRLMQDEGVASSPATPVTEALGDISALVFNLVQSGLKEEDEGKREKILGSARRILERDITIKRYPLIGAYAHRMLMDAIFSGVDPNYEASIIKRQDMYRREGYEYWWGEQ